MTTKSACLPVFERADPVLQEQQVGVVDGVEPDRLLAGQGLLGVEPALVALGPPGDRDPHPEERVVRVDRPERADLLHVVGAAPGDHPGREQAVQRLEVAQPVVAELGGERPRVEVEPGRLDVDHDAQPGGLRRSPRGS